MHAQCTYSSGVWWSGRIVIIALITTSIIVVVIIIVINVVVIFFFFFDIVIILIFPGILISLQGWEPNGTHRVIWKAMEGWQVMDRLFISRVNIDDTRCGRKWITVVGMHAYGSSMDPPPYYVSWMHVCYSVQMEWGSCYGEMGASDSSTLFRQPRQLSQQCRFASSLGRSRVILVMLTCVDGRASLHRLDTLFG